MHEAGGHDAYIEVITSASSIPEEVGQNYLDAFGKLGGKKIRVMDIRNREDAQNRKYSNGFGIATVYS